MFFVLYLGIGGLDFVFYGVVVLLNGVVVCG